MTGINIGSPIGKMLADISWEGRLVAKKYRDGGQGKENVLTTEIFLALQFLPRFPFVEEVAKTFVSEAGDSRFLSQSEIESAEFVVFPSGNFALRPSARTHQQAIDVQIDAIIQTESSTVFVEAKRIGKGSFQEEQLARTFLVALRESGSRRPRVLFIPGADPPVLAKGIGRVSIKEGILARLAEVYSKTEGLNFSLEEAAARIDQCVAWTTWPRVSSAIEAANSSYSNQDQSTANSVSRIARYLVEATAWHNVAG